MIKGPGTSSPGAMRWPEVYREEEVAGIPVYVALTEEAYRALAPVIPRVAEELAERLEIMDLSVFAREGPDQYPFRGGGAPIFWLATPRHGEMVKRVFLWDWEWGILGGLHPREIAEVVALALDPEEFKEAILGSVRSQMAALGAEVVGEGARYLNGGREYFIRFSVRGEDFNMHYGEFPHGPYTGPWMCLKAPQLGCVLGDDIPFDIVVGDLHISPLVALLRGRLIRDYVEAYLTILEVAEELRGRLDRRHNILGIVYTNFNLKVGSPFIGGKKVLQRGVGANRAREALYCALSSLGLL